MVSFAGLSWKEIENLITPHPAFRAKQIFNWINRGVFEFEKMTDIPRDLQNELKTKFCVLSSKVHSIQDDIDTKKIVLTLHDNIKIEAVLLNDGKERYTACLSTQAGCPAGCVFCKTGTLGFKRNLTSCEIVEQLMLLNKNFTANLANTNEQSNNNLVRNCSCGSCGSCGSWFKINNIVIMGMGEPLLNLTELRKAISFFTDPKGMNFSRRRITISTCGICDGLFDLAKHGPYTRLALSLTTADEKLRKKLMPVTKVNPLDKIKDALQFFQNSGGGRVTLEIPLLGGINTRKKDAEACAEFAGGLDCIVNIIPWNPVENLSFEGKPLAEPLKKETEEFVKTLEELGLKVTTRYRKGRGVNGACGQLGSIGC